MEHLFNQFNGTVIVILLSSIVALAIFFERLFFLSKREIDTTAFFLELKRKLSAKDLSGGLLLCEEMPSPATMVVKAALVRFHLSKEAWVNGMEMAGRLELAALEKNAKVLSMIAYLTPMMGLLGTVLGLIQAFAEMRVSGLMDISSEKMGYAMEYALVTTAFGLAVAIPSVLAYNYLVSRIDRFVLEMEMASCEIIDLLENQ